MFLVHITDTERESRDQIRIRTIGVDIVTITCLFTRERADYHNDVFSIGVYQFGTEKEAVAFAHYAAKKKPGLSVQVATITKVMQTMPSEVVVKSVTEKGILPA